MEVTYSFRVLVKPGKLGASLDRERVVSSCAHCGIACKSLPNPRSLVRSGTVQRIRARHQPNFGFLLLYLVNKQSWLLNCYFLFCSCVRKKERQDEMLMQLISSTPVLVVKLYCWTCSQA